MKYRTLGKTNLEVSEIGLGTWQLGNADWGVVEEKEAIAVLHAAVDNGVNLLDTANVYGLGVSEQVIGKFLKETKAEVHVATKLGREIWVELNGWPERFSLEMVRHATQESLKNLGVESVFLQQWHCVPPEMYKEGEIFEHLESIKKEGLIQHWGCSVESVEEGLVCAAHPGCAALQVIFNIFRQKLIGELFPACVENNVGILARVPLASGMLTGKIKRDTTFAETDHRNYNPGGKAFNAGETFGGLTQEQGVTCAEKAREILPDIDGADMAQLALRWILDHESVSTVIPGATRKSQVESNVGASDLAPLAQAVHEELNRLYKSEIESCIAGVY